MDELTVTSPRQLLNTILSSINIQQEILVLYSVEMVVETRVDALKHVQYAFLFEKLQLALISHVERSCI
jgi:hypothetical protein